MNMFFALAKKAVLSKFDGMTEGRLTLRYEGEIFACGNSEGPSATVTVHDPSFFTALALGGHVGAAESYIAGEWDADDLTALVQILALNRDLLDDLETGLARLVQPLRLAFHALNRNSRPGSKRNILAHYDLGNDFFAQFLDDTMTYSCGIFETPASSMREASIEKYDRICRKLELTPADHVIEIGTGWGGFAIHAASKYGCRVTTTTISDEQYRHARQRVTDASLNDRVTLLGTDYRDLEGSFDKLVSIEMIEAVGHHYFEEYFERCAQLLRPHGTAVIQTITIQDRFYEAARREVDFIKRFVFPGSCIPAVSVLASAATATDLRLIHLEDITPHYAETVRRWRSRFLANWPRVRDMGYSEEFKRMWLFYLAYCEGGFNESVIGDVQLMFAKPRASATQVGRAAERSASVA